MRGGHNKTHGDTRGENHLLYQVWCNMKDRCLNQNADNYHRYGGRSIGVCAEWIDSYQTFRGWALANGYRVGLQIDRRENDGNYEPGNCRFVPSKANARNRGDNHMVTAFGETKCISAWVEDERCPLFCWFTLFRRLKIGMSPELAITKSSRNKNPNRGQMRPVEAR